MPELPDQITGVVLPGNSSVEFRTVVLPEAGPGQVVVETKASSICGSDIRAIYREHLGKGPEAYQNVIAGHEPAGRIVKLGPGCKARQVGQRVVLYHISGCGCCDDCRAGYQISCTSGPHRKAYGWQRDGGHAPYILAEEVDCVPLPDGLTYVDGAFMACGFGTAWECLRRMNTCGTDRLLVVGLGPVGLAAAQLGRVLGVRQVIGLDVAPGRLDFARSLFFAPGQRLVDTVLESGETALQAVLDATCGEGCEVTIDCSGAPAGRLLALQATRQWGRCGFVGEGRDVRFDVSPVLIHKQVTLFGSWVTSLGHLAELAEILARHGVHPEATAGPKLPLDQAEHAYRLADAGQSGKVCIVWD
ncbi:MAG: zinc-dependent alcohol dehydrogenase family protein [Planctomycetota bacterium]